MQMALYDLKQKDVKVVFLEVRESNKRAHIYMKFLGSKPSIREAIITVTQLKMRLNIA